MASLETNLSRMYDIINGRIVASNGGKTTSMGWGEFAVRGGNGNDVMISETKGMKTFSGGKGDDTYVLAGPDAQMTIVEKANEGFDTVVINSGTWAYELGKNLEAAIIKGGIQYLIGNSDSNILIVTQKSYNIDGGAGDDIIKAPVGTTSIYGGAGADTLLLDGDLKNFTFQKSGTSVVLTEKATGLKTNLDSIEFVTISDKKYTMDEALKGKVNTIPVATNDAATVKEDGSIIINVKANDKDADADALTITQISAALHGQATLNADGTITYKPVANYNGSDSFTYTISDGNGGTAKATVNLTVTAVNDGPVAVSDAATLKEDGSVIIKVLANDSDIDGDVLKISALGAAKNGALILNADGTVTYTPAANFNGTDNFTYTITDGKGGTATGTVNLTVTAVNDGPVAVNDAATLKEDTSVIIKVLANDTDIDGNALKVTTLGAALNGTVLLNADGTVTYTPIANFNGTDKFTYTISDGNGGTATATVNLTVSAVNDGPVAANDTVKANANTAITFNVLSNDKDIDGDALSITTVGAAAHGTAKINADGTITYTPTTSYSGADRFTYTISDGKGGTSTATVTLDITAAPVVNKAPTATNDTVNATEDKAIIINVLSNDKDADGDALKVTAVGAALHGTATINTDGTITYTPVANYNGTDKFTYTISDGKGGTATATVNLTVAAVNDGPVGKDDTGFTGFKNEAITIQSSQILGNDTDLDGDALRVTAVKVKEGTGNAALDASGNVAVTGTVAGTLKLEYTLSDGKGGTSTALITVAISEKAVVVSSARDLVADVTDHAAHQLAANGGQVFTYGWGGFDVAGTVGDDVMIGITKGMKNFSGGKGNDTYVVYDGESQVAVIEKADEGFDTIVMNGGGWGYAIEANVEAFYSTAGVGNLTGNDLDNVIVQGGKSLQINAGAGNDIISVPVGTGNIDGGTGTDTLILSGNRAAYSFTQTNGLVSVTELATSLSTTLSNIEKISFLDGDKDLSSLVSVVTNPGTGGPVTPTTPTTPTPTNPGTLIHLNEAPQPTQANDLVGLQIQNGKASALAATFITTNQVFEKGELGASDHLVARINGVNNIAQFDAKTFYEDGSVKTAIITFKSPSIAAKGEVDVILAKTTAAEPADINVTNAVNNYNFKVAMNIGGTNFNFDAGALLKTAIANHTTSTWLAGPNATELRFDVPVKGSMHLTFDVTFLADGTINTDVQFKNDYAMQQNGGAMTYDVSISQNGSVVFAKDDIYQIQYTDWRKTFSTADATDINVVHDIQKMIAAGVIASYDLDLGVASANIGSATGSQFDILGGGDISRYMPGTGGRPDIGPTTLWDANWILTQDAAAAKYALAQADQAGSLQWHFFDPTTGTILSLEDYPALWTDYRGTPTLTQGQDNTVFQLDVSHQPDMAYTAYMMTGDRYYLDQLNAEANQTVFALWNYYRQDGLGLVANGQDQVRAQAWGLRQIVEAAYANPEGSEEKTYFTKIMDNNFDFLLGKIDEWTAAQGEFYGIIPGTYGSGGGDFPPWQQDYFASTVIAAVRMGNEDAKKLLEWQSNFLVGRFIQDPDIFNPHDGVVYNMYYGDARTWEGFSDVLVASGLSNGTGWSKSEGDYSQLGLNTLAGIISVMHDNAAIMADAVEAYGWLVTAGAKFTDDATMTGSTSLATAPMLSNGEALMRDDILNLYDNNAITIDTGKDVNQLIYQHGTGNAKMIGGEGINIFFGGSGNDELIGGNNLDSVFGNYLFGKDGNDMLVSGAGHDFMQGGNGADTFVLNNINNVDTIDDFNKAEGDKIDISSVLQGYDPLHDAISDFVQITQQGKDSVLKINADGAGNDFTVAAVLTDTSGLNVADLVQNHALIV